MDEYGKTGSIGKGIIGGGIETLKSIGPLEGMTLFAPLGPVGIAIGGTIGFGNVILQAVNPHFYDDIKDDAYKLYDNSKVVIGKGISQGLNTAKHVYKDVQNVGKSLGKAISSINIPKFKWG